MSLKKMTINSPRRKPSKRVVNQILRLDHEYLSGNYLTKKDILNGFLFWIDCREGRSSGLSVCAYVLLQYYKSTYTIRSVVVLPKLRGKGIANKLLLNSIKWIRRKKGKTLHTYASAYNYPSINMLTKSGFKVICYSTSYSHIDGKDVPWLSFRREI